MRYKNLTYLMTHPLLLMWFMVLWACAFFLLWWQSNTWYMSYLWGTQSTDQQRPIWHQLRLDWTIEGQYGFGAWYFRATNGQQFIIKSTITTINQLTWSISIQGVITEYNWLLPVVNVYQHDTESSSGDSQLRYHSGSNIVFHQGYDATISVTWDITSIVDPIVSREVVRIRSFSCEDPWYRNECDRVLSRSDAPHFVSSYRHKFIQFDGLWYVFDGQRGYRFWSSDQYYLTQMAKYFDTANDVLFGNLLRSVVKDVCVGPQASIITYDSHRIREQNGNTFIIVRGLNEQDKMTICQLRLISHWFTIWFEGITTIPIE